MNPHDWKFNDTAKCARHDETGAKLQAANGRIFVLLDLRAELARDRAMLASEEKWAEETPDGQVRTVVEIPKGLMKALLDVAE